MATRDWTRGKNFTDEMNLVLEDYFQKGMRGTGKAHLPAISKAAIELKIKETQVMVSHAHDHIHFMPA